MSEGSMKRIRGPVYKNRIPDAGDRGERADSREALLTNGTLREFGGRAEVVWRRCDLLGFVNSKRTGKRVMNALVGLFEKLRLRANEAKLVARGLSKSAAKKVGRNSQGRWHNPTLDLHTLSYRKQTSTG